MTRDKLDHGPDGDRFDALLRHSIRTAPMPEPPPDFARRMEGLVTDRAEDARVEAWLTRLSLWSLALATFGLALYQAGPITGVLDRLLGGAPWPMLLVIAVILSAVKLLEFAPPFERRSHRGGA
ncbi:hypothetical protein [Halomonas denitrificans]|nr:hypothetical protein [Halomonas denitrificans]